MRIYPTLITHQLEDRAQKLGYDLEIRVIEPHEDARYFVTAVRSVKKKTPAALGWTDAEALDTLRRGTWKSGRISIF
jgi:hypothetical protein